MSESSDRNPVEVLADEFVERLRAGESPSIEAFTDRHPECADEILELFPLLVEMEQARSASELDPVGKIPLATPDIEQLDDYRIVREIGRGGMGIVFEAEQISLGRRVALKVLPGSLLSDPKHRSRFARESKAAASLHHTNIVPVFGVGEQDGLGYYAMQYINGHSLDTVLSELKRMSQGAKSGKRSEDSESLVSSIAIQLCGSSTSQSGTDSGRDTVSHLNLATTVSGETRDPRHRVKRVAYWDNVAKIGVQVASALSHAHMQGVLHRDIKPANLLLEMTGNVWVTDFGLASLEDDHRLTETGDVLGTLRYMAPEAFQGISDARSEVFSLGLTLFELLVLSPAFDQRKRNELIDSVVNVRIEPIHKLRPDVPSDLQTIVHKAIERDPDHRYQTAEELADDLTRFLNDQPIKARRVSLHERFLRWRRQNRGLAGLAISLALTVTLTAVGATIAAGYFLNLSHRLDETVGELKTARSEAENRAKDNLQLANRAETAKRLSDETLADMYTQRGVLMGREGDDAAASLWFANAATLAPHDAKRRAANRLRAKNWLSRSMKPLARFDLNGNSLSKIAFQPNGSLLMMLTNTQLRIWDWRREEVVDWTRELPNVKSACWSPDGRQVAMGRQDGTVQVRDVGSGNVVYDFKLVETAREIAWSPNGVFLATASSTVQVWDMTEAPKQVHQWSHPKIVYGLTFNQTGERIVTACHDQKARLFKVGTESADETSAIKTVRHAPAFRNKHARPVFFDDDQKFITVDGNRPYWWNVETGEDVTPALDRERPGFFISLAASPDGKWVAGGGRFAAMLWNTRGESYRLEHGNNVRNLCFDPQSKNLLTISLNQHSHRWALPPAGPKATLFPQLEGFQIGAVSGDGKQVAVGGRRALTIWGSPEYRQNVGQIKAWGSNHWRPRLSSDGSLAIPGAIHLEGELAISNSHQLNVVNTTDGQRNAPTIALTGGLIDSCFCDHDQKVAAACALDDQGSVAVYDRSTGKPTFEPIALSGVPLSLDGRSDASELAVLCSDGNVLVIDAKEGVVRRQWKLASWLGRGNGYCRVEYTPDGMKLVAMTPNHTIEVLDADSGERIFPPIRPVVSGGPCRAIDISADSRWLATAVNGKNFARVWDLSTGQAAGPAIPHAGDVYGITNIAFSPDGNRLLTGHHDGNARLWDWRTGELSIPPMSHPETVADVSVTADGKYAATGIRLGTVYFWDLDSGKMVAPPADYQMPIRSIDALAITGNQLIVSDQGQYPLIDLSVVLRPPTESTEAIMNAASVMSNQSLQFGELSRLEPGQWERRFAKFKQQVLDVAIDDVIADGLGHE